MKETTNLKLKLYDTADAPNLVAGYNASMEAIDKASAEWGTSELPANIITQTNGQLFSPTGTPMTVVGIKGSVSGAREAAPNVALSVLDVPTVVIASPTGSTKLIHGSESFSLNTSTPDITLTTSGGSISWAQLKAALAAIETMKTQVDELQTQIAAKADTSTVTALTTRVATAEGEIDTLQTGLAAATAAGTAQLTVADLTAAKTNTKNLVTA